MKWVAIGGGVAVLAALGWMLMPSPINPEMASTMVLDFFPRLK